MDRSLLALINVVEAGNLTRAADKIGLAQPSLTKRLKQLEYEYGVPLFKRLPNGMAPTEFGHALYRHAKSIEQRLRQASEEIAALKTGELDVLRIGSGPVIRSYLMRSLFPRLRHEYPAMKLEFRDDIHQKRLKLVEEGELDIFFGIVTPQTSLDGIEAVPVTTLHQGVLAHKSHPFVGKKKLALDILQKGDWISHEDGGLGHAMVERHFRRHSVPMPSYSITTTSLEFGMELLAEGRLIMAGPVQLAEAFAPLGIKALNLKEHIDQVPIHAYMRASTHKYPAVSRVMELVGELAP